MSLCPQDHSCPWYGAIDEPHSPQECGHPSVACAGRCGPTYRAGDRRDPGHTDEWAMHDEEIDDMLAGVRFLRSIGALIAVFALIAIALTIAL